MTHDADHRDESRLGARAARPGDARERPGGPVPPGVPRLSRTHLTRPRIVGLLDDDWPLVVLHAPQGYGKTAALAEWIRTTPRRRVLWLSLDAKTLAPHLVASRLLLAEGSPARPVPVVEPGGVRESLQRLAHAGEALDLAIDAGEFALHPAIAHELLELVRHVEHLRLRLATRTTSILDDVSTALAVDTIVLGARELSFTAEETTRLAALSGGAAAPARVVRLHAATGGWPFAVRAAMQLSAPGEPSAGALRDPFEEGIAVARDRLLDEFAAAPGAGYVLPTVSLESFTLGQARALGAEGDGAVVLDGLERRGLGGWERSGAVSRFRLQPLLREALLARTSPAERLETQRRLARWFEPTDPLAAFRAAVAGEEWALAARLARREFAAVAALFEHEAGLLAHLPGPVLRAEPVLCVLAGLGDYIAGNLPRAMRRLRIAVATGEQLRAARTDGTRNAEQLWVQALTLLALRLLGRHERLPSALRSFRRALDRVEDADHELDNATPLFTTQTAMTELLLDRLDEAATTLADSTAAQRGATASRPSDALTALVQVVAGDVVAARASLATLRHDDASDAPRQGCLVLAGHLATAHLAIEELDADRAANAIAAIPAHWSSREAWPLVAHAAALARWIGTGAEPALALLVATRADNASRPPIGAAMTALLDALQAELLLALGRSVEAHELSTPARRRGHVRLAIPAARGHLISGESEIALELADRTARDADSERVRLDALAIAASAARRGGEEETARRRFHAAAEIVARTGMRLALLAMPRPDFLALAAAEGLPESLVEAVASVAPAFPEPGEAIRLTRREQIVLGELATGATTLEIAQRLSVSTNTIKAQIRSASRKLAISGRTALVAEGRRRGLI